MIQTTLCYIEKNGCYLMLHRTKKKKDINRDKWIGIGGKFEAGESPFDCVRREVAEETGLSLPHPSYRGIITFISEGNETEYMHLFTADTFDGELAPVCDEGDLAWVEKEKVFELALWEGDRLFLSLLDTERRFFSLKLVYRGDTLISHTLEFSA